jgi:undecaprenyl-diphosphatase
MTLIQILVLALVQGFTEFLPISSSAHLILVPVLSDWPDQGLAFDVAVHVGTLSAVVMYFRHELLQMSRDWLTSCVQRRDVVESTLRSELVIAWATIGFGLLLWLADVRGARQRHEHQIGWRDVLVIGLAQAVALIPGTSRSGITMTAGLFMGLTREAAARFSFLLSVPTIFLAGSYKTLQLVTGNEAVAWGDLLIGIIVSGITAYLVINLFLKWLDRNGMLPFVLYRLLLGGALLYFYF